MLNFASITKIYPSLNPVKKKPVKRKRGTIASQLPVSKETILKVIAALQGGIWLTFKEIGAIAGLSKNTVSRASKVMCRGNLASVRVPTTGKVRSSYLRLIA